MTTGIIGPLIEKATNFFNKLQSAPSNVTEHINTAVGSLNPFQQQQYVNYAIQNPDQAITAAQQNKDFLAATQKNIAPAPASMADGGRVFYLQGGLTSLLG
jgi:N-acetylmuramic acid 6-phosphate (MurNAc-6-P) etherase